MDKIKLLIGKVMYAFGSNAISLLVALLTTLVLPKFFGNELEQYGYLQVYLFYIGFIGFFHFGLCDGIYLRDAGKQYSNLNKGLYSLQFWLLTFFEGAISICVIIFGNCITEDRNYMFIWVSISFSIIFSLPKTMIQYYLQTTNRIKEYAFITTIERASYGVLLIAVLCISIIDYRIIIIIDVVSRFASLVIAIYYCRDIVFSKPCKLAKGISECITNIKVGIKLMFANIASYLITGIVRFGIQQNWDVGTYGKISFTLSVSNIVLTFIGAVGVVLYPTLRQADKKKLPVVYQVLRNVLMIPLLGCLIFYYPIESILAIWLPQYAESMRYMAILFPLCIFSAKMTMLVQTYMNVYRMEKEMLKVNCVGVVVSIFTTVISVSILDSLTLAMISIVVNQIFRCVYAEIVISKKINVMITKDIAFEILLTTIFIICNWFIGGWSGVGIYLMFYLFYCFLERGKIKDIYRYVLSVIQLKNV